MFRTIECKYRIKKLRFCRKQSHYKTSFDDFFHDIFHIYLQNTFNMQDHTKAKLFLSMVSSAAFYNVLMFLPSLTPQK